MTVDLTVHNRPSNALWVAMALSNHKTESKDSVPAAQRETEGNRCILHKMYFPTIHLTHHVYKMFYNILKIYLSIAISLHHVLQR